MHQYGITVQRPTELGIYGSKRTLLVESPFQFKGGKFDVAEMGAFTYLGDPTSMFRHINKIGRFCAIASDIQVGHVEHSITMLSPHPMFVTRFDSNWKDAECLYEDMDFVKEVWNENAKSIKRRSLIEIGNDVWIGQGVFISRGVKIGDGAVIAARSVVVNDVPPYTVVGGIPAKPIKQRFSDEVVEKLLDLKWWEYGPEILKSVKIYDMEHTLYEIENRIAKGIPKYNPDKIEFNLESNTIYHLSNDGVKTLLHHI